MYPQTTKEEQCGKPLLKSVIKMEFKHVQTSQHPCLTETIYITSLTWKVYIYSAFSRNSRLLSGCVGAVDINWDSFISGSLKYKWVSTEFGVYNYIKRHGWLVMKIFNKVFFISKHIQKILCCNLWSSYIW